MLEPNIKSTATVMQGFFIVMASFLAFIVFIPNKELVHWLSFMFILLAEFTFFIGHLFLQMLPLRTSHAKSKQLLLAYLILTIVLGLTFMLIKLNQTGLVSVVLGGLFGLTLLGLIVLGSRGKPSDEEELE